MGDWKLVALGPGEAWELYNIATDRTESHDLARERPDIATGLAQDYSRWAARCGVIDYPKLIGRIVGQTIRSLTRQGIDTTKLSDENLKEFVIRCETEKIQAKEFEGLLKKMIP